LLLVSGAGNAPVGTSLQLFMPLVLQTNVENTTRACMSVIVVFHIIS